MLGRIDHSLGDDVVRADLDMLRQPSQRLHVEVDRDRCAAGERLESGRQAALGEDRRVKATRDLATRRFTSTSWSP